MENEEIVQMSVQEELEQQLAGTFEALKNETLSQEERARRLSELRIFLEQYMEMQKIFNEQDLSNAKFEDEKLNRKKERRIKIFDIILNGLARIGGIIGTAALSMKLYDFAEKGNYTGRDQMTAINSLHNTIGKL